MRSPVHVVGVGYTGRRILERVPQARGVSRSRPDGIDPARVTLADLDGEPPPLELPGSVIYTVPPATERPDSRLTRFLSALQAPPGRVVYLSTTGVYGDRQGRSVHEADDVDPQTERAKRRVAAEERLRSWATEQNAELVVLRVPGIYGPGRLMLDRARSGEPLIAEADAGPGNRIHVDDLVSCCVAAVTAPPGIYNLGDGDLRSSTWFVKEVARQIGVEPGPEVSRAEAEQSFSARRLSFLSETRRVDTAKMRNVLGVIPKFSDAAQGIRESLEADYREASH